MNSLLINLSRFWRFINFLDSKIYFTGRKKYFIHDLLLPLEGTGGVIVREANVRAGDVVPARSRRAMPLIRGITLLSYPLHGEKIGGLHPLGLGPCPRLPGTQSKVGNKLEIMRLLGSG